MKLKQQGFLIHAKPETGTKRRDFDFTATLRNCTLNCEVTLLRPTTFSRRNVLNALGRKRKQLPDDAPAFIDCFWPVEHWRSQVPDMRAEFMSIAEEFFRGSRRVNYLAFSNEEFRHREGGGALLIEATTIAHANPRHRSHFLDIAMQSPPRRHQEIKEKLGSEEQHFGGFSEYDEWVDSLFED